METSPKELRIYITEEGREPFSEWLISLRDQKARARIRVRLDRVSLGNLGDCHGVGDAFKNFGLILALVIGCISRKKERRSCYSFAEEIRARKRKISNRPSSIGRTTGGGHEKEQRVSTEPH